MGLKSNRGANWMGGYSFPGDHVGFENGRGPRDDSDIIPVNADLVVHVFIATPIGVLAAEGRRNKPARSRCWGVDPDSSTSW
jgi:hypothetical protein